MRAYLFLLLFALLLGLPFAMRPAVTQKARAGSGARLVVVTPHNQDIRREFERAFTAWHQMKYGQPVDIDYRTPGGSVDTKRLLENTYGPYRGKDGKLPADMPADIDIVWGGGDYFFSVELKRLGDPPMNVLQPLGLDPKLIADVFPRDALAGVRLYDGTKDEQGRPAPLWVGVALSSFGIVYNPDVYETLGLTEPRNWHDLTDEKLAGLVALADPSHSGSAATAYLMVIQRKMADAEAVFFEEHPSLAATAKAEVVKRDDYREALARGWKQGMAELLLIAANARYFTDSTPLVPNDVGNGEAAAGVAIDFYGRVYQESVGERRCRFIAPSAATAITPDPVGILAGVKGKQLELARHFVEFLLTREGQLLWNLKPGQPGGPAQRCLRRLPVRVDVYGNRRGWADDIDPFVESGGFNQRGEWMRGLSDLRLIWVAAWIDSRDELRESYGRILRVADSQRRATLIAELADLPIEMGDLEEIPRKMQREAKGNFEEWKARNRIEWARKFRSHYAGVKQKAGG
jgi:ABC-type Fe3+ transport system substrate-binding protein